MMMIIFKNEFHWWGQSQVVGDNHTQVLHLMLAPITSHIVKRSLRISNIFF